MPQRPKTNLSRNTRGARKIKLKRRKMKEKELLLKYAELYSAELPFQINFDAISSHFLISIKNERSERESDLRNAVNSQYFLTAKTENTVEASGINDPSTSRYLRNIKTEEDSYISNPSISQPVTTIKIESTEDLYSDTTIRNTEVLDSIHPSTSQFYVKIENSDPIDTQDMQTMFKT